MINITELHLDVHNDRGPVLPEMCMSLEQANKHQKSVFREGSRSTNSIQKARKRKGSKSRQQKTKQRLGSVQPISTIRNCADMMGRTQPLTSSWNGFLNKRQSGVVVGQMEGVTAANSRHRPVQSQMPQAHQRSQDGTGLRSKHLQ